MKDTTYEGVKNKPRKFHKHTVRRRCIASCCYIKNLSEYDDKVDRIKNNKFYYACPIYDPNNNKCIKYNSELDSINLVSSKKIFNGELIKTEEGQVLELHNCNIKWLPQSKSFTSKRNSNSNKTYKKSIRRKAKTKIKKELINKMKTNIDDDDFELNINQINESQFNPDSKINKFNDALDIALLNYNNKIINKIEKECDIINENDLENINYIDNTNKNDNCIIS